MNTGFYRLFLVLTDNTKGSAIGKGNNPMVGMTVACAVAIEEAQK